MEQQKGKEEDFKLIPKTFMEEELGVLKGATQISLITLMRCLLLDY